MPNPGPVNSNRQALQLAVQLHQQGRFDEAERLYRQVLQTEPRHPDALHLLGLIEHQRGNHDAAQSLMDRALMIKPGEPTFLVNLSQVYRARQRYTEAEQCLRRAIAAEPRLAEAHSNLASVLRYQKRLDEAEAAARHALSLNPKFGNAMLNLGTVLEDRGDFEAAIGWFSQALKNGATRHDVLNNLGDALCCLGRWEEGRQALEEAVQAAPLKPLTHWNLSLVYLVHGDYLRGFAEHEWRLRQPTAETSRFSQPMWAGESLGGKSILLHMEQGYGDAIQFVRYVPLIAQRGGNVLIESHPQLIRLLETVDGVNQIIPRGQPLPPFEVHAPLLSLPYIFGTTLETIPASVPYLHTAPEAVEAWKPRIPREPGIRNIGLSWSGNPTHRNDRNRSLRSDQLAPLASVKNVRWFNLQVGSAAPSPPPGLDLIDLAPGIHDFADTAAVMSQLDLVISVDTATAHLAGALGRPVWVLLPFVPDWRWLLNRTDSPWYPTARLFRQSKPGDWASVIARLCGELSNPANRPFAS